MLLQMDNVMHLVNGNTSYLKLHCAFLPGTQSSLVEPGERKIQNNNGWRSLNKESNGWRYSIWYALLAKFVFLIIIEKKTKRPRDE